jgi:hypothetical protein
MKRIYIYMQIQICMVCGAAFMSIGVVWTIEGL